MRIGILDFVVEVERSLATDHPILSGVDFDEPRVWQHVQYADFGCSPERLAKFVIETGLEEGWIADDRDVDQIYDEDVEFPLPEPDADDDLGAALDRYTDPNHPEFDPEFTKDIKELRPDWFADLN
jgi:hypothetical protein